MQPIFTKNSLMQPIFTKNSPTTNTLTTIKNSPTAKNSIGDTPNLLSRLSVANLNLLLHTIQDIQQDCED